MDIWFTLFVTVAALLAAAGFSLVMIGYINSTLASFQYGWKNWGSVLLLPVLGGIVFCFRHRDDHLKTGRQLAIGALCLIGSFGMLYGAGPAMVRYMASNMMAEKAEGAGTGVVVESTVAKPQTEGAVAEPAAQKP